MFDLETYNYSLPKALIAQEPASERDAARLLCVERLRGHISDHLFSDLPHLLQPGDLLVVNNTRVVPARLFGRKETGGSVEILVLESSNGNEPGSDTRWCLLRSSKRPKKGSKLFFESGISGEVTRLGEDGLVQVCFQGKQSIDEILEEKGAMPVPPYIKRESRDPRFAIDRERYQTIFSKKRGAVAAPTAGLHFTEKLVERLRQRGILLAEVTLHVGCGTFRPVRTRDIRKHDLGAEDYVIESGTAKTISECKSRGRRVIAVGTTVVRTLETAADGKGKVNLGTGKTDLLITPGYRFKIVDGLITNFHLPRSSLLFLVCAFAGTELIKRAYQWAIEKAYRFYSYGDAMLIT